MLTLYDMLRRQRHRTIFFHIWNILVGFLLFLIWGFKPVFGEKIILTFHIWLKNFIIPQIFKLFGWQNIEDMFSKILLTWEIPNLVCKMTEIAKLLCLGIETVIYLTRSLVEKTSLLIWNVLIEPFDLTPIKSGSKKK